MSFRNEKKLGRKIAAATLTTLTVTGLTAGVAQAAPALPPLPPLPEIQAPSQEDINNFVLEQRDNLQNQTQNLPEQYRKPAQDAIDEATNFVAPGALAARAAAAAAETARRDAAAREEADRIHREQENAAVAARMAEVANSPCPATARACVDLAGKRSWLQDNGQVVYGPVASNSGGAGQETPTGTFRITRKVKDEISREFNNAPMPWAVYFTNNGHAFHQGSTATTSAGCVRLDPDSARTFFNHLNPGDEVFIY